jgi:hypothetical protein
METRFAQVKDIAVAIFPGDELDDGNAAEFKEAISSQAKEIVNFPPPFSRTSVSFSSSVSTEK